MTSPRAARIWQFALPPLTIVAVVVAWEALVRLKGIAPIYLPAPSSVFVYLSRMIADGSMPYHLGITLLRIFVGFGLAAVFGIALGVLMGMSRTIARVADVWIAALYPLPKISLIPLLIIWLGTGEAYRIVIELAPRSAYVLRAEARWGWQHSVAPTPALRYSITFRTRSAKGGRGR